MRIESQPKPAHIPRILLASWISFCMMVTRFACIAQRLVSSNRWTRNASAASWRAWIAWDCHRSSAPTSAGSKSNATSRTSLANGSFEIRRSYVRWYLRISFNATVPGRYRWRRPCGVGSPAMKNGQRRMTEQPTIQECGFTYVECLKSSAVAW